MVKFGIIGTGQWGTKVIKAIRALGFECAACNGHGVFEGMVVNSDYKRFIQCVDIVFIAAHPRDYCEMALYALVNRKTTIVEKPVGFNAHEVMDLMNLSRENKTPLIVDYTYLFNSGVQALKRNDLRSLSITMGSDGPVRDYSALWDWGSHAIAIVLDFIREPLTAVTVKQPNTFGLYRVDLQFETKAAAIEVCNTFVERTVRIEASCWSNGSSPTPYFFEDNDRYNKTTNPLAAVISTAARLHLRGEYWTNGDLAVEVTDLLERLHAMLPK